MLNFTKGKKTINRSPSIVWDPGGRKFTVLLPMEDGSEIKAEWQMPVAYVVRLRKVGSKEWSFGFETPLTACSIVGLEPDTEYEMGVSSKNEKGESEPAVARAKTTSLGELGQLMSEKSYSLVRE